MNNTKNCLSVKLCLIYLAPHQLCQQHGTSKQSRLGSREIWSEVNIIRRSVSHSTLGDILDRIINGPRVGNTRRREPK